MRYTQRIAWHQIETPEKLHRLLAFLGRHRPIAQEISVSDAGDGQDTRFMPPQEVARRAEHMVHVVRSAREAGFRVAINILNTMGHSDEPGPGAPSIPWQGIMAMDGTVCRQCNCPADPDMLDYIRAKYAAFAAARPDTVWIDDDARMWNHPPVAWGCFCPRCVRDFSRRVGREFDRDSLRKALAAEGEIRRAWADRNGEVLSNLLVACAEASAKAAPGVEVGFMVTDIHHYIDCAVDLPAWFSRMASVTGQPTCMRPGFGVYCDDTPRDIVLKVNRVAQTVDCAPPKTFATYELETYPYTLGGKSLRITGLECLLAILSGRLDGIMLNIMDMNGNDLEPYESFYAGLSSRWREHWDGACRLVEGTTPVGWRAAFSLKHFQNTPGWPNLGDVLYPRFWTVYALQQAGLPFTGFRSAAGGGVLCGQCARGMSPEELERLLDSPLIMDGESARYCLELGLGARIGLEGVKPYQGSVYEQFSDHPINAGHAGYIRVASYHGSPHYGLAASAQTETISQLYSCAKRDLGAAATLYRSPPGPPVAVLGYMPWAHLLSPARMSQLRILSAVMLGDAAPVTVRSQRPITWWLRRSEDRRRWVVALFNDRFDPAEDVHICLPRGYNAKLALATEEAQVRGGGDSTTVTLAPWSVAVMELAC